MKDYACERIYRDARITSIYEGTTQLQVVAAIRHVTTGTYKTLIENYAAREVKPELQAVKDRLVKMTQMYVTAVEKVTTTNDSAYSDFMARRLVEMAGDIVMCYLLLDDANRNDSFTASLHVYANLVEAEICKHADFIAKVTPAEMEYYKKA